MSGSNENKAIANALPLHRFARVAGAVTAACGALAVAGWHAHWTWFLKMIPDAAPIQYNTALCFILCGAALFFVAGARKFLGAWLGGLAAFLSLLTWLEYLLGRNFGIDQFFSTHYLAPASRFPGRMSPLTAVCFIFIGGGLMLAQARRARQTVMTCVGILACVVAEIACVALVGYVVGISAAYGWGAYSQMAIHTATLFVLLGIGMMTWVLQAARIEDFDFRHLLPVSGSVALMIMIAIVAGNGTFELQNATALRKHTFDVILTAQALEEDISDIQRWLRSYVISGDTNALESYSATIHAEKKRFKELAALTVDNSLQSQRLAKLSGAVDSELAADERTLAIFRRSGVGAAMGSDAQRQSRAAAVEANSTLRAFNEEEKSLLFTRDNREQDDFRGVSRLLIFGSGMAVVLLLAAYYMASHQRKLRHQAEVEREKLIAELQKALAEVKTLSGMIPICAWCKNIRSDQGFWQSVEEYVGNHTHAEFSHGVCPKCEERIRAELKIR